ncbi:MAG: DNA mismatch repair protein MutS [Bacilli bacterium]
MSKVTPMMKQYLKIKEENNDIILFFRLGDFYEMFFEDAITASRELELTLTGKNAGLDEKIPMCGIPHHAANIYITKLTEKGYKVGICEQLEDPKNTKGIVKRDVVQIISIGTNLNTDILNEKENNYIGNIIEFEHAYAISYADISTGEIYVLLLNHEATKVISEVINLNIKEIITTDKIDKNITDTLKKQFNIPITITNDIVNTEYSYVYDEIEDVRYIKTIKHLLSYINKTQKRSLKHLQKAIIKNNQKFLKMNIHTKRNLELTETIRLKQRNYSLIWLLDKTKTAMGSRMLATMINYPLTDLQEINKRYDIIATLIKEFIIKSDLQNILNEVYDLERLSGKIAFGTANARDLLQMKKSLNTFPKIKQILKLINYSKTIEPITDLYILLEKGIHENPPISLKEGYLIKEGYNKELDELKIIRKGGKDFVAHFEMTERERTKIKNLKIGYNKIFGYYIEISKGNISLVKDDFGYERRQTLSNCERYISPILKEKEALILTAEEKIIELEYQLFNKIREEIKSYIPKLQNNAKIISEIDVLQSLATIAEENNYVRPILTNNREIKIINNRHPVLEKVSKTEYVENDIIMDEKTNILLITGPNMAGKSTYMRQVAITIIMAQIGSFVPAKKATLPIFDAIFTRIGASDDLVSGQSTFMVEMLEAKEAITNASENSLMLFDELGRGTATFDGIALAQAILEYIHNFVHAKTLFSTHYHELTDLENTLENLKNIHVSAQEENGTITFLHKIKNGSVDKSYGIHVAKLSNLPVSLIKRADDILKIYENKEQKIDLKIQKIDPVLNDKPNIIEQELTKIDPLNLTPLEALTTLYKLKELNDKQTT